MPVEAGGRRVFASAEGRQSTVAVVGGTSEPHEGRRIIDVEALEQSAPRWLRAAGARCGVKRQRPRSDCSCSVVRRPAPAGNIQRHLLVRDVPARMSAAN